ncbi:MAG: zinc ribbon domain-containing protein [Gemmatimonadota bacterium]|jgi:rRNA maturation endonuclease Nob1|nr:zinc ribbon domain-containing protein [Gemmatimonadota bacterium]MDQ8151092.1 zinc ribbon domain-containing protein [Gemmatimonadota bacterium]MDQ8151487.1 zinc ribbon domain-containing protein [Gemmatimonadota bacterium]MDQ8169679.1 zinc ribbon domain-containing protein [Gemmatimonadota bacterium]MDQ8175555.1 zinc ribbon domain-containing protein [Gemmatimonadota bacterium]
MIPLLVGSLLAVVALAYVLLPILRTESGGARPLVQTSPTLVGGTDEGSSAIEALREVEFDRATGKLSDDDYAILRATYAPPALAELRAREGNGTATATSAAASSDAAERLIARMRTRRTACGGCGPRPEPDALFCSSCGGYLEATCLRCQAPVPSGDARFCVSCGESLAA